MAASGEPGIGRTCLKPYEIDPTGQAQVCADPCDPTNIKNGGECTQITPKPTPVATTIPNTGASVSGLIIAVIFGVLVAYLLYLYDNRNK